MFGVGTSDVDIEKTFRLGKYEDDNVRPLLNAFKDEEIITDVMKNLKKLRSAETLDRYRNIGLSHDLTLKQREVKKCVDEAKKKQSSAVQWILIRKTTSL